jgi:hypothetical protein
MHSRPAKQLVFIHSILALTFMDPYSHLFNVKASFYMWNRKKRTFLESLNEHLKHNVFSQD